MNTEKKEKWSLPDIVYLLVVTSTCLFILNINNETITFYINFNDSFVNKGEESTIGLIRSAALSYDKDKNIVFVNLLPIINDSMVLLKISLKNYMEDEASKEKLYISSENSTSQLAVHDSPNLTLFYRGEAENRKSLLMHNMNSSQEMKCSSKLSATNSALPVTFHKKIRSSGYGKIHKSVLFQPQINRQQTYECQNFHNVKNIQNYSVVKKRSFLQRNSANFECKELDLLCKVETAESPAVSSLQVTTDGNFACCTSAEGLVHVLKIGKQATKIHQTFNCHNDVVNASKWSYTGKMIVTCGEDKTVKIWDFEHLKQNPLLIIGRNEALETKRKFSFRDAVEQVQFYYLDKFILAAAGNKLHLFNYMISTEKNDIKRYMNKSALKLIKTIPLESKRLISVAAVNQFFSNIVLCSGTSKSIDVIDMAVGKVIWHSDNIGTRPAHLIAINEGSPYSKLTKHMYDLFLTSSIFDGIKVWDLRSRK
ncbi:WD repeat-containing protein 27-like [Stegodyphus dumicola]|uniref:WD repeat-containing protein 27-like n=1 Tax=Stegodyphus dumicola TaxID=202533 RepID=UPI0015B0EF73|nr:WD repeat-containing protein 27-like [Stegodyphus dumicola]